MNADERSHSADEATAARLAKLRTMPVETSRLDAMIQAKIPRPTQATPPTVWRIRPLRAVAASIALLATIGLILWSLSGGAVYASPDAMARFHQDLVAGKVETIAVDSIAQANSALARQWEDGVELPQVPQSHAMLCCMQKIKDTRVACVLLQNDGVPVTLAVAKAMDMKMPQQSRAERLDGVTYHVQSSGSLNMVMTQRDGRWICLIGALPTDRLMRTAGAIQF
jgi:hypothetical protein